MKVFSGEDHTESEVRIIILIESFFTRVRKVFYVTFIGIFFKEKISVSYF